MTDIFLRAGEGTPADIRLRDTTIPDGGAANVTPGTGQLVATGFAPTVQTPLNVQPGTGQLVATGYAATVQTPRNVRPGTGQITATGFAPTVQTPRNVQPGTGQLTATGYSPTVQTPRTVLPGTGQLVATGFAPTVDITSGAGVNVTPGTGQLLATGYAPTVAVSATPEPPPPVADVASGGGVGLGEAIFRPRRKRPAVVRPGTGRLLLTGYAPTVVIETPAWLIEQRRRDAQMAEDLLDECLVAMLL